MQAISPACAFARGGSTLHSQSRDMEAEMQQLIQSRLKTGQSSELKLNSVSFCATLHACQSLPDSTWTVHNKTLANKGVSMLGLLLSTSHHLS